MLNRILTLLLVSLVALPPQAFAEGHRYEAAKGQLPDVTTIRQVVRALGVGRIVEVQTNRSPKLRATITAIDERSFTVGHGRPLTSTVVAYDEVVQLKPVMRRAVKTAIAAGCVAAVVVLVGGFMAFAAGIPVGWG